MKRFLSLILVCAAFVSVFLCRVSAAEPEKKDGVLCTDVLTMSGFIFDAGGGEIVLGPAVLKEDGKETDVYAVSINGMCYDLKKANNIPACVATAFNLPCKYYRLVKSAIADNIPEGSRIIVMGHSLGGMIAQRLICDEELTEAYEFLHTVTVGSPYIMVRKNRREGTLTRLADISDNVPKLSPALLFSRKNHKNAAFEDGGYDGDIDAAHNRSYREAAIWEKYDALGIKGGSASFIYYEDSLVSVVA